MRLNGARTDVCSQTYPQRLWKNTTFR